MRVCIVLPDELWDAIGKIAEHNNISRNAVVRQQLAGIKKEASKISRSQNAEDLGDAAPRELEQMKILLESQGRDLPSFLRGLNERLKEIGS